VITSGGGISSLNGLTGETQTFTNDTNVTIVSAGTAHAITWSGALPVSRGGTNATSASITAFNNITGLSAAGTTGTTSTNLVFSTSPTFATSITGSYLTASEMLITDGSKNIVSAPVATYPSLTELSYVKGVTSAIQTQLGTKQATITFGTGVQTALGVNIGSAGAPVLFDGAGGTPSSLTGTNISGTAASLTAGSVTNATLTTALTVNTGTVTLTGNVANTSVLTIGAGAVSVSGSNTGDQTSVSGNAGTVTVADAGADTTTYVLLATDATGSLSPRTDAGLTYNANTNELTTTTFIGALTGNVTGNVSGTAATVTGAAQTAITSVGTLTGLAVSGVQTISNSTDVAALTITQSGTGGQAVVGTVADARSVSGVAFADAGGTEEVNLLKARTSADGSNYFYRNLTAASTAGPVVHVKQDHASDDQNAHTVYNDGTGYGQFLDQNGNATAQYIDSEATTAPAQIIDIPTGDAHQRFVGDSGNASPTEGDFWRESTGLNYYNGTGEHNLIPEVTSAFAMPTSPLIAASTASLAVNTTATVFSFNILQAISVAKCTTRWSASAVNGTFDVVIYSEDGQTQLISYTTGTISGAGADTVAITPVFLNPGRYYALIVPNSTASCTIRSFDSTSMDTATPSGEAVWAGVLTVTASTPPATIDPTAITATEDANFQLRFDT